MSQQQIQERVRFATREAQRYREDVEEWKSTCAQAQEACYAWEDLIAKANFLLSGWLDIDTEMRLAELGGTLSAQATESLRQRMLGNVGEWLSLSPELLEQIARIEREYGQCDGGEVFRRNVAEAQGILTSDEEFFRSNKLNALRDQAEADYREGRVRPV